MLLDKTSFFFLFSFLFCIFFTQGGPGVTVQVEQRASVTDSFGRGQRITITLEDLARRFAAGEETLYLSPQTKRPLVDLKAFLPTSLLPTLISESAHVWAGVSRDGSSSGLHHDYHDNLVRFARTIVYV